MLDHDLEPDRQAIQNRTQRTTGAQAAHEIGIRVRLEDILAEETEHAEDIVRLLRK